MLARCCLIFGAKGAEILSCSQWAVKPAKTVARNQKPTTKAACERLAVARGHMKLWKYGRVLFYSNSIFFSQQISISNNISQISGKRPSTPTQDAHCRNDKTKYINKKLLGVAKLDKPYAR